MVMAAPPGHISGPSCMLYPGAGLDVTAPWLPGVSHVICIDELPRVDAAAATPFRPSHYQMGRDVFYSTIDEQLRLLGLSPSSTREDSLWTWLADSGRRLTYIHSTSFNSLTRDDIALAATCSGLYICGWLPRNDADTAVLSKLAAIEHVYLAVTTGWQTDSIISMQQCLPAATRVTFHLVNNCASRLPRTHVRVTHDRYGTECDDPVQVNAVGPNEVVASAAGDDDLSVLVTERVACMTASLTRKRHDESMT